MDYNCILVLQDRGRGDHFRFGSVFIKKNNLAEFFFFEKKTETEPKPGQTDRFRFGSVRFFEGKNRFKLVWLGFSGFGLVFSGFGSVFFDFARFFRFGSVLARFFRFDSVWLGFFSSFLSVSVRFWFGSIFSVFCL